MCVRYHASLSDGTVVESRLEGDEYTFVTESGEVPEGLDQAVMSMKKGEVATFEVTAAYGYAAAGRAATATGAAVPPDAALKYAITLVDFTNVSEHMRIGQTGPGSPVLPGIGPRDRTFWLDFGPALRAFLGASQRLWTHSQPHCFPCQSAWVILDGPAAQKFLCGHNVVTAGCASDWVAEADS